MDVGVSWMCVRGTQITQGKPSTSAIPPCFMPDPGAP